MASMTLRGDDGAIKWAWHDAAQLGSWTLTARDAGADLTAAIRSVDDFKIGNSGLTFCVVRPSGARWVWPVLSWHIAGGTLNASLGPQE